MDTRSHLLDHYAITLVNNAVYKNRLDKFHTNTHTQHGGNPSSSSSSSVDAPPQPPQSPLAKYIVDSGITATKLFTKAIGRISDSVIPTIEEAVLGDLADKPPEEVVPNLTAALHRNNRIIQAIMNDPQLRQEMHQIIKSYAMILTEVYKESEPEILVLVDAFWESLNEVARRSGQGAVNTAINFVETAIAEIPVMGGMIDLAISLMRAFNTTLLVAAPMSETLVKSTRHANEIAGQLQDTYTKNIAPIQKTWSDMQRRASEIKQIADDV